MTQKIDRKFQQGFSLLEILFAFSILSIMLGILLRIFSGGVRVAEITGNYAEAVQIAESLMATVGVSCRGKSMPPIAGISIPRSLRRRSMSGTLNRFR